MPTDTNQLIDSLSNDLKPVTRLPRAAVRAVVWTVTSLAVIGIAICTVTKGFRADLPLMMQASQFRCQTLGIFTAGILAAFATFRLCVPDTRVRGEVKAMAGIASFIWLMLIGSQIVGHGIEAPEPAGEPCLTDLSLFMAVPLLAVIVMVMRAASTFPALAGYCAVLSSGSFAALGMRLLCPNDEPAHLLAWHFLPILIFALCGLPLGKILLKMGAAKK